MNQTPRTEPLAAAAPTTVPSPFYLAVGCAAVILGLMLGIGGYFGVRALVDDDPPVAASTEPGADPGAIDPAALPTGAAAAVPKGTVYPFVIGDGAGQADVLLGAVNWGADEIIADANQFNDVAPEGEKFILVTAEVAVSGEGALDPVVWVEIEYVDESGGEYARKFVVTPNEPYDLGPIADGGEFTQDFAFQVPEDTPDGGYFVLSGVAESSEQGTWIEAV